MSKLPDGTESPAKPFDLLNLLSRFARAEGIALDDPELLSTFAQSATRQLNGALADPSLLHGTRIERLFEATVISLGQFRLLKAEDSGRVHAAEKMRPPDFRIVLEDGEQWLIEVKNVRRTGAFKQRTRLSATYLRSLQAYADAVGAKLKLAIYWSLWSIWTVISPEHFRRQDGSLDVKMIDAISVNEFSRLGEMSIATRPPLRIFFEADLDKPRGLDADGQAHFTPKAFRIFAGGKELKDPKDLKLAEILFFYGDWPLTGPCAVVNGDGVAGAELVCSPEEPSDQGFDGIGWASRIFSRFYANQTIDEGRVVQLLGDTAPEWFAPLANWDFVNSQLSLWLMRFEPNAEFLEKAVTQAIPGGRRGSKRSRH